MSLQAIQALNPPPPNRSMLKNVSNSFDIASTLMNAYGTGSKVFSSDPKDLSNDLLKPKNEGPYFTARDGSRLSNAYQGGLGR